MNMITFTARSREQIVALHERIADGADARDAARVTTALEELEAYTIALATVRSWPSVGQAGARRRKRTAWPDQSLSNALAAFRNGSYAIVQN